RVFGRAGARVLVVARNEAEAKASADEITAAGGTASAFSADVCDLASMEAMAQAAVDRHGGLDVLCANAGIFPQSKIVDMSGDEWDLVLGTNLKGTFNSVKACIAHLAKSDGGRIILTSSITGPITGFPGWTHYGASKAGQLGFMRTACIELAKYGITVNAVAPGLTVTDANVAHTPPDRFNKAILSRCIKREQLPEDLTGIVLFLASSHSDFITGQLINVDGGNSMY
ncbi:MAG: SDR family oxidoreductase, partial [Alphaproteobacteria bacterium]|nr:SDR family oxidoreductase [Alphaproteobacteria bacterium]